jgi:hypothetical protein
LGGGEITSSRSKSKLFEVEEDDNDEDELEDEAGEFDDTKGKDLFGPNKFGMLTRENALETSDILL